MVHIAILDGGNSNVPQTQLALDIRFNLARFPNCILLTRVGQFYESYFDQAPEVARLLDIKLTSRRWGGSRVHMCGFPLVHLDRHLKVLVSQSKRFVALCEEFKVPDGFERRVVRIVTPGTLIDESFLNHYENNYLVAISTGDSEAAGLAWIDVSTGEFFSQSSTIGELQNDLARISPQRTNKNHPLHHILGDDFSSITSYTSFDNEVIPSPTDGVPASTTSISYGQDELAAVRLLTSFLRTHLLETMPNLPAPVHQTFETKMQIDSHTIAALEIKRVIRDGGVKGSLLSTIKRTVTRSGTRLLSRWLCSPSTSLPEVHARQELVALFKRRPHLRADLTAILRCIGDVTRIVQKLMFRRGDISDLVAMRETIQAWISIRERVFLEVEQAKVESEESVLNWACILGLMDRMVNMEQLATLIGSAISDMEKLPNDTSSEFDDGEEGRLPPEDTVAFIGQYDARRGDLVFSFSPVLQGLHQRLNELHDAQQKLEKLLQGQFNVPSLTLRANPQHGPHVHIAKVRRDGPRFEASDAIPISRSKTTSTYFLKEWSQLGSEIIDTQNQLFLAERSALEDLRNEVNAHAASLRRNASLIDELDVLMGFADLAHEMNFVRPTLSDEQVTFVLKFTIFHVANGRHPTVEMGLFRQGRTFTPNTVLLSPLSRLHIITGPNMSGKSSLLRQSALIVILAQVGSFVPADNAHIGIVDAVFTRVGAKDDLYRDRSTFMVEMLETAEILKRATDKSMVIMDEVGRGTTIKDGVAIAFATAWHLYRVNQCRTLFATHFHEVADMLGYREDKNAPADGEGVDEKGNAFPFIKFFCTGIDKFEDGRFSYSHRLRPGVNRDSHGIEVAQMAGIPLKTVNVASRVLKWMGSQEQHWLSSSDHLRILGSDLMRRSEAETDPTGT
ncbi:muts domain V-domain-containing protein [Cantharellus anzutake]|uniref:muts domain V-domain-containing protein n=1 Tax=Cantharellus anzutake TaxID=1750568 RepID=UPI00190419D2|nr:muts domain V-domain-containing protein [Cantharellus anzutake]KAF8338139.1 muts domain V-domain-containing protein [Cantharellus anzutake]